MRKVSTFLAASLGMAWVTAAGAQTAPDMFKDLDPNHWAYQATENLRSKGILIGYPDGYFRGKRTLTRYEFAVALDRLLKNLPQNTGPAGPAGPQGAQGAPGATGDQGPKGEPGMTPDEVAVLRKLTQEFRDELAALGNNMAAVNRRLDAMAKDIADIRDILSKMPKIWGRGYFGVRANRSTGTMTDHDGRTWASGGLPFGEKNAHQDIFHVFDLGVNANIAGGAKVEAVLSTGNYHGYLGGNNSFSQLSDIVGAREVASETFLTKLAIMAPLNVIGRGGQLTLGRQGMSISHLTLMRPDLDTYFNVPGIDNGEYILDGAKVGSKLGSVNLDVFAGTFGSVQTSIGDELNNPLAGGGTASLFGGSHKPTGQVGDHTEIENIAGLNLSLGLKALQGGSIRLTAIDTSAGSEIDEGPFNNVWILGSGVDLKLGNKLNLNTEWGKTIGHNGREGTVQPHDGNAFTANLGWSSGGLNVNAGYKYIDPLFYAPGYWGRIGNWLNPTNVQGPTVRVGYHVNSTLGLNVGGDFFSAAKGRGSVGGLTRDDDIHRILVGLRWDVAKNFQTTLDWEGVYWKLQGDHGGSIPSLAGGVTAHPTEHFIRIGTGYHLTSGTLLRFMYEIGEFDGHNTLVNSSGAFRNSYNVFTSSLAVKF